MKTHDHYTDLEIVQKIVAGDAGLFEIIIRRNNSYLYRTGRAYNFSHEDTQDLMQDTYINAYTHLSTFENRSSLKTWIIRIMLNNCYKKQRKWSYKNVLSAEMNDKSSPMFSDLQNTDTGKMVMNRELNFVIENALQQVPVDYRIVFILREVNGLNVAETADSLNISESNVKIRLSRAKAMLRKEVEKSYSSADIYEFNLVYCDAMVKNIMNKIKNLNL